MRTTGLVPALLVTAALLLPATAQAHTGLAGSRPASGERLAQDPTHVVLEFAQPVTVDERAVVVTDPSGAQRGRSVLLSQTSTAVSVLLVPPAGAASTAGAWTVAYRVRGRDGHVVAGRLDFAVDGSADQVGAPLPVLPAAAAGLSALAGAVLALRAWVARVLEETP